MRGRLGCTGGSKNQLASAGTWALCRRRGELEGESASFTCRCTSSYLWLCGALWEVTKAREKQTEAALTDGSFEIQLKLRNECETLKSSLLRRLWELDFSMLFAPRTNCSSRQSTSAKGSSFGMCLAPCLKIQKCKFLNLIRVIPIW